MLEDDGESEVLPNQPSAEKKSIANLTPEEIQKEEAPHNNFSNDLFYQDGDGGIVSAIMHYNDTIEANLNLQKDAEETSKFALQKEYGKLNQKILNGVKGLKLARIIGLSKKYSKKELCDLYKFELGILGTSSRKKGRVEKNIKISFECKVGSWHWNRMLEATHVFNLINFFGQEIDYSMFPMFTVEINPKFPDDSCGQIESIYPIINDTGEKDNYLRRLENLWIFRKNISQGKMLAELYFAEPRLNFKKVMIDALLKKNNLA